MNAPEPIVAEDTNRGLSHKFNVTRIDGSDAPGERNHGHRYLVLDLDKLPTDAHAKAAVIAYAESCEDDFRMICSAIADHVVRVANETNQKAA